MTPLFLIKDYIKSKVSEPLEKLFFFNSAHLGAAYLRKIESFMEDHYCNIRGELLMKFCRGACLH